MELVEDAVQLHDMKAKVLEFATVNDPVMYIGIPLLKADVARKLHLCTRNDELLLSATLCIITILA